MLEIQKYIPDNIRVNHIRGHQDKKKRKEQLTMAEKLNIMADTIIEKNASISKIPQWKSTFKRTTSPTTLERKYVLIVESKRQLGFYWKI